jgi:O-antigen/teichoic acid export membrane protein
MLALTNVLGPVLLASMREKTNLRIVSVNAAVNLVLGVVLISQFGLIGAALTAVLTRMVDLSQHYLRVSRLFSGLALGRLAWRPLVASACMAAYLFVMGSADTLLTIAAAVFVYGGVLLALVMGSVGGPRGVKARYSYLWSK